VSTELVATVPLCHREAFPLWETAAQNDELVHDTPSSFPPTEVDVTVAHSLPVERRLPAWSTAAQNDELPPVLTHEMDEMTSSTAAGDHVEPSKVTALPVSSTATQNEAD